MRTYFNGSTMVTLYQPLTMVTLYIAPNLLCMCGNRLFVMWCMANTCSLHVVIPSG